MKQLDLSIGEKKLINKHIKTYTKYISIYPHEIKQVKHKIFTVIRTLTYKKLKPYNLSLTLGNRTGLFNSFICINNNNKHYVIIIIPYYQIYKKLAEITNKKIIFLKQTKLLIQLKKLNSKILTAVNCIFICNPNNFNGSQLNAKQIRTLIKLLKPYNIYIIYDDCYSELTTNKKINILKIAHHQNYKQLILLLSLSKRACAPGLRSGVLISKRSIINKTETLKLISGTQINCSNQIISKNLWLNHKLTNKLKANYKKIKKHCLKILSSHNIKAKAEGFYISIPIKQPYKQLLINTHTYKTTESTIFGLKNHIRLAITANKKPCLTVIKTITKLINTNEKKNTKHTKTT